MVLGESHQGPLPLCALDCQLRQELEERSFCTRWSNVINKFQAQPLPVFKSLEKPQLLGETWRKMTIHEAGQMFEVTVVP